MTDKAETMLYWESNVQAKTLLFLLYPTFFKYVSGEQIDCLARKSSRNMYLILISYVFKYIVKRESEKTVL